MMLAITQARLSSSRFPRKIEQKILGMSILEIHLKRILKSKLIDKVIVAVADEPGIEVLEKIATDLGVTCVRGSIDDVLLRFHSAASPYHPEAVVRLTTDCPLVDPQIIDGVVALYKSRNTDYVSNTQPATFADGFDVEVIRWKAFNEAFQEATLRSDREHVTKFIWTHPERFSIVNYVNGADESGYRLTIDYAEDFEVLKGLIDEIGLEGSHRDYVDALKNNAELRQLNQMHIRNEALKGSL